MEATIKSKVKCLIGLLEISFLNQLRKETNYSGGMVLRSLHTQRTPLWEQIRRLVEEIETYYGAIF